jgi:6-phosphofructokinase 1
VAEAIPFITAANVEAEAAEYGIGIVRLMGRECGHLAVNACLASRDVNICIVPEISF